MDIEFTSFEQNNAWVEGIVNDGEYSFVSKLFDNGSCYGINEGRVSKLSISYGHCWRGFDNCFVNYDRGWDIQPQTDEEMEVYESVLEFLETAPKRQYA